MIVAPEAQALRQFVEQLECPCCIERSLKFTQGHLNDQRFLLSIDKAALGEEGVHQLALLVAGLKMPSKYQEQMLLEMLRADIIHLGYEGGESGSFYKVYLEFAEQFLKRSASGEGESLGSRPELLHIAFKWDAVNPNRAALTYYRCHFNMLRRDMDERIKSAFTVSSTNSELLEQAESLSMSMLDRVCQQIDASDVLFMQVSEEGNDRNSFDINLYDAELKLKDVEPVVTSVASLLGVADEWGCLFEVSFDEVLGHMAAGIGRDGRPFFSFYYGVEVYAA